MAEQQRVIELWNLFKQYRGTPFEYSHAVSKIDPSDFTIYSVAFIDGLSFGEFIAMETRDIQSLKHIIEMGLDFPSFAHIVLYEWFHDCPGRLYNLLVELAIPPNVLSDPWTAGWSPDTAVKCAIIGNHHQWLRILLEYGCRLPYRFDCPDWASKMVMEVAIRKINCRRAVIQLLGIARFRRRAERDTIRMVAMILRTTWREDEWLI
jgi:hypothetical protein